MIRQPLYVDDVIECFDDHLNSIHESIEGMLPSEIIFKLNENRYYNLLEVYIQEHYGSYRDAEETMYTLRDGRDE